MASTRPYYARAARPESAPNGQLRMMQPQQPIQQQPYQQQFQQQPSQQPMSNQYGQGMMNANYPGQQAVNGGYGNSQMAPGISPTPSARMGNQGMQVSPALAATAPQNFGPSVCHLPQAQIGQQPQPAMYNNCQVPQGPVSGGSMMSQPAQQPAMPGCNMQQASYAQSNYAPMSNQMMYNNFNNGCNGQQPMTMNTGYMNQQCGHSGVPSAQGYHNPCSPCNGHHHPQPPCNSSANPVNNNWQCGYPNASNVPQQQQQSMPYQQQQNGNWNVQPGNAAMNPMNGQQMMYNMAQQQAMYNNYNSPPPYNQAIQCQDVSQSQDFRGAPGGQVSSTSIQAPVAAAATAAGPTNGAAPSNMRPEAYQRTLEYVQQCQSFNKPKDAKVGQQQQTEAAKPAESAAVTAGRGMLSPGQETVTSSSDRQEAMSITGTAAIIPAGGQSNMIVHDMNTSLNSLMQENRFLQMIQ